MNNETIQKLQDLKQTVMAMQNIKGRQSVINRIRASILFLQMYKVDEKTTGLLLKARENDVENLGMKEYKQVEIDWRMPKKLRR